MCPVPFAVFLDARVLDHVMAAEGLQRRHAEKPEVHVRGKEQVVHGLAAEQVLPHIAKGLGGRVEGQREHVLPALQRPARPVLPLRRGAAATVALAQPAVGTGGIDLVHVPLAAPRKAHPVHRRLHDDPVRPQVTIDFRRHVIGPRGFRHLHRVPQPFQRGAGQFDQMTVQSTGRMGIGLVPVDDQDVHGNLAGLCARPAVMHCRTPGAVWSLSPAYLAGRHGQAGTFWCVGWGAPNVGFRGDANASRIRPPPVRGTTKDAPSGR